MILKRKSKSFYLTVLQIASVLLAVGALFFLIDTTQSQYLVLNGNDLARTDLDNGPMIWGMNFFLFALLIGVLLFTIAFFIGFKDD
ncbi:MAG: hypothetical protein L0L24_04340 [Enterobacterales bacterium]|uniref:Uncharacterized protein n=1 Tax=Obesumbacterium proteus ATCC 12841 TaxID=1354268 RepID=A0AA91EH23_9GAMM|nr:hypothetical protein [Obesumbacterium proteus]MDN6447908.1 hypothetical protein [Enterobacterales bacterium]AMO80880.1 hypothetical protein DSM2777_07370 [Obesumbacterium proteus]KKI44754.1 hypothetical protein XK97_13970 [Obesumbacterium proteus]MCE9884281.1 hypothetical protein [Obesumbacterium proteus]MCE9917382.1 hypothetical protein [Obesumbacterium proteus]